MERGWRREAAEEAAILAKEAGATWDPEEPELPERILPVSLAGPGEVEAPTNWAQAFRNRREAAARYNAVERFKRTVHGPHLTELLALLAEERERLSPRRGVLYKGTLQVDPEVFR